MPRVSNQLLLFAYVSPFCLFKIAYSPLTHRSPRIGRISGAGSLGKAKQHVQRCSSAPAALCVRAILAPGSGEDSLDGADGETWYSGGVLTVPGIHPFSCALVLNL